MLSVASGDEGGHPLWRFTTARLALAAIPLFTALALLTQPVPWPIKLAVALVLGVTRFAPEIGLLTVAAAVPFGDLAAVLVGWPALRATEAIMLAFLAGWLLSDEEDRPGPRLPRLLAWLLAALAVASVAGQAWSAGLRAIDVPALLHFFQVYYATGDRLGFIAAAHLLYAVALAVGAAMLFRQHPRLAVTLPAVLVASAAVAAAASALLYFRVVPAEALVRSARLGSRASQLADMNAAGSHFCMALCLALGMAGRARGHSRVLWVAGAVAAFSGLLLSGSRSALYATLTIIALAVSWAAIARWPVSRRAAGLAALISLVLALAVALAVGFNRFLQVGALDVAGLVLLVAWIGAVLVRTARAIAATPHDWRLLGAGSAVATVCVTSLAEHPLLVDELMFPFWILFGLTAGLAAVTTPLPATSAATPLRSASFAEPQ